MEVWIKIKGHNSEKEMKSDAKLIKGDDYVFCKKNEDLQKEVEKLVADSNIEVIEEVIVKSKFEW